MSVKYNGFEGPLPSSIKLGGFHCHRRGGCDRDTLCEENGGCMGVAVLEDGWEREASWRRSDAAYPEPPLMIEWRRDVDYEETGWSPAVPPAPARLSAPVRSRLDELADLVLGLTYAEMLEFAHTLWKASGATKMNSDTLPKILLAWTRRMAAGSDHGLDDDASALEADAGSGAEVQSIDTAPRDRPILVFMMGRWRVARWSTNQPHKRPVPFWSADDLRVTVSRAHQPQWWADLPAAPPPDPAA